MGIGLVTGSISPGKRADLMLIDTRRLGLTPFTDAAASVVQSATPADVHTVIADGRVLKQAGKLVGIDVDALMKEAVQAWGTFLPHLRQRVGEACNAAYRAHRPAKRPAS